MSQKAGMNWLTKILESINEGRLALGPGVHHVQILHDEDCMFIDNKGPCNCNPEVKEVSANELH